MIKNGSALMAIQAGFTVVIGDFIMDAINQMTPWLIVMVAVIICDLVTGVRKSIMLGEDVRFSRACRATMGKFVSYFSFVVAIVFINVASGGSYDIDKWLILFICFIEFCSVVSNILRPIGYNINGMAAIGVFLKKVFGIEKEDTKELITKNKKQR